MPLTSRSANLHGQICASSELFPVMWTCWCLPGQRRPVNWARISGALLTSPVVFCRMPFLRSRRPSWHWSKMTLSTSGCASTCGHGGSTYSHDGSGCSLTKKAFSSI